MKDLKTGSDNGWDILRQLANYDDVVRVHRSLSGADDQSAKLLREVMDKLAKELKISSGAKEALSRLVWIAKNGLKADPALLRNNIFKAAHSLKLKLPSMMFASQSLEREWFGE
jgi:hypothetical protein